MLSNRGYTYQLPVVNWLFQVDRKLMDDRKEVTFRTGWGQNGVIEIGFRGGLSATKGHVLNVRQSATEIVYAVDVTDGKDTKQNDDCLSFLLSSSAN